jgi:hypothetical protein
VTTAVPTVNPFEPVRRLVTKPRVGALITGAIIIALLLLIVFRNTERVSEQQQVQQSADTAQTQLQAVADPVAAQCASDATVRARLGDATCNAAAVAVAGAVGPAGPIGEAGTIGATGNGIVATVIRNDGHLIVSYSNGDKVDAGPVVGKAGSDGKAIAASGITNGHLLLTFSDGTVEDLGAVVGEKGSTGEAGATGAAGANGRGIANISIVEDRLIVTYDDQTTSDAGAVPAGPAGANGSPARSFTFVTSDGVTQQCTRAGGDDEQPTYDCSAV